MKLMIVIATDALRVLLMIYLSKHYWNWLINAQIEALFVTSFTLFVQKNISLLRFG